MRRNKSNLIKRFNRAVATFDNYAILHKKMAHRLLFSLQKRVPQANRILEVGCGTGYFTQLLIDNYPEARITAVDFAENMIDFAKEKMGSIDRVQFTVDDAEEMIKIGKESYDLIVSNATIHLLQKPEETLRLCYKRLEPDGWLLASTFGPDSLHEFVDLFEKAQEELNMEPLRPIHHVRSGEQWEESYRKAGFSNILTEEYWLRLNYKDCCHFLRSVRSTGHSYNETDYNYRLMRQLLKQVIQKYNLAYRSEDGVYATYHMMQFAGQKKTNSNLLSSCYNGP